MNHKKFRSQHSEVASHDIRSKPPEIFPLFRLRQKITKHLTSWTILETYVAFLPLVSQEEIPNVDSTSSLA